MTFIAAQCPHCHSEQIMDPRAHLNRELRFALTHA